MDIFKSLITDSPHLYGRSCDESEGAKPTHVEDEDVASVASNHHNQDAGPTRPARTDSEVRLKLDAQDVYNQLVGPGKGLAKSIARTKLMFVGRGRSGKTSTRKSLKHEQFDAREQSTRGACTMDICARSKTKGITLHQEELQDWTAHVPRTNEYKHATAQIIASRLWPNIYR